MCKKFDVKSLQRQVKNLNDRCIDLERSTHIDEKSRRSLHLMSIFCHHINGSLYSVELSNELFKKEKYPIEEVEKRVRILEFEIGEISGFLGKFEAGEFPEEITLKEYGTDATFVAVDEGHRQKIKYKVTPETIESEKSRIKSIIKHGGAYYYKDMLEELETGNFNRYHLSE